MICKKIPNFFLYVILVILGVIFLTVWIKNAVIFGIASLVIIYFIAKKSKSKRFGIYLFVLAFVLRLLAVSLLKTPIEYDFKHLYDASLKLLNGDLSYNQNSYFIMWGYQIGQVLYQTLLLKICNSVFFLKVVNCLISSGIVVLIYHISKEFLSETTSRIVSLLYCIYMFPLLFNSVLSNQILSTFLIYLAIYIMFGQKFNNWKNVYRYLVIGCLFSISNIIRPEGIVSIAAIIVFFIYELTKKNYKQSIKNVLLILNPYYAIFLLVSNILIVTNISPSGLVNKDPLWKFVLGFNHESVGAYATSDEYAVGNREIEMELIKDRTIKSIDKLPMLFIKKTRNFWFSSDIYWSNNYLDNKNVVVFGHTIPGTSINQFLINYNSCIYFTMYLCLFVGLFKNCKRKKNDIITYLSIFVSVNIGVYLLVEIMPRYAYCASVSLFILSGLGIEYILHVFSKIKKSE